MSKAYFQATDLANIASELDQAEKALLSSTGSSEEEFKSSNVDDSGNFSIQVLSEALRRAGELQLVQDSKMMQETLDRLQTEEAVSQSGDIAFVCNLQEHWFAIRSLRGEIWNLNSLKRRPEKISLFYLSACKFGVFWRFQTRRLTFFDNLLSFHACFVVKISDSCEKKDIQYLLSKEYYRPL